MDSIFNTSDDEVPSVAYDKYKHTFLTDPNTVEALWKEHFERPVKNRNVEVTRAFDMKCSLFQFMYPELPDKEIRNKVLKEIGVPYLKTKTAFGVVNSNEGLNSNLFVQTDIANLKVTKTENKILQKTSFEKENRTFCEQVVNCLKSNKETKNTNISNIKSKNIKRLKKSNSDVQNEKIAKLQNELLAKARKEIDFENPSKRVKLIKTEVCPTKEKPNSRKGTKKQSLVKVLNRVLKTEKKFFCLNIEKIPTKSKGEEMSGTNNKPIQIKGELGKGEETQSTNGNLNELPNNKNLTLLVENSKRKSNSVWKTLSAKK